MSQKRRLLIEEWLPAAAIGVECMRERSTGQNPPNARLHVWFARRPLCASRAAVLGSLLPADFPRDVFERLLGFGHPGEELVRLRKLMDTVGASQRIGFGCDRAFKKRIAPTDVETLHNAIYDFWDELPTVVDPMAGGGSIPLESARLGLPTVANELNPVACTILEATIQYPIAHGLGLGAASRHWADELRARFVARLQRFFS